jgi:APA family basic amino acid/polyamine antiporter
MSGLRRTLGLGSLTFYGVGLILGAGIYSILGVAAGEAGDSLWISFLCAASVALLTALSYAELATMFPKAGAEYFYFSQAFPHVVWARRMLGVLLMFASVATASTVATAFAGYLGGFVAWHPLLVSAVLLTLMASLNLVGIKESSWVNIAMTSIEVIGLVVVIVAGAQDPDFGKALVSQLDVGFFAGAGLVFFSYLGFEDVASLAEEAREPDRDLPRAILLSLVVSTVLYVLVALAAVALLPPERLAQSDRPLAAAVAEQWPRASGVLGGIALFATANTALIAMIAASRMAFAMGRKRDLPQVFAKVLPKRGTPWLGAILVFVIALSLLPLRDAAVLGGLASFGALIAFSIVNVCLVVLRKTQPDTERPFRVPLVFRSVPVLPVVGVLGALALAVALPSVAYLSGLAFLAVLGVVEFVRSRVSK